MSPVTCWLSSSQCATRTMCRLVSLRSQPTEWIFISEELRSSSLCQTPPSEYESRHTTCKSCVAWNRFLRRCDLEFRFPIIPCFLGAIVSEGLRGPLGSTLPTKRVCSRLSPFYTTLRAATSSDLPELPFSGRARHRRLRLDRASRSCSADLADIGRIWSVQASVSSSTQHESRSARSLGYMYVPSLSRASAM